MGMGGAAGPWETRMHPFAHNIRESGGETQELQWRAEKLELFLRLLQCPGARPCAKKEAEKTCEAWLG